jgi:glutamyl-tRNA synthetase
MEDIDRERCRSEFEDAALEDLHWLGLDWDEGGEKEGAYGPYRQSEKAGRHEELWRKLIRDGWIYPSPESRCDILTQNPTREVDGGVLFPPGLRKSGKWLEREPDGRCNWRFRIPEGEVVEFEDRNQGVQRFVAGKDFGDFLVWRKAGGPSYELAVVADDLDMGITEVVRGEDLLLSTARQILLYRALGGIPPVFQHEKLVCDAKGERLSKTAHSVSIRSLREQGWTPAEVLKWRPEENPDNSRALRG